jgi:hypothetical protein
MATRQITYAVEQDRLLRQVCRDGSHAYTHACTREVLEQVAWYMQEYAEAGASTYTLRAALPELPFTQVHVALSFLGDQGCLSRAGKRWYPTTTSLYEEALEAFYYLAEESP